MADVLVVGGLVTIYNKHIPQLLLYSNIYRYRYTRCRYGGSTATILVEEVNAIYIRNIRLARQ